MLPLLIIPVLIWGVTADRWHLWLLGATVVGFLIYVAVSLRAQMKRDAAARQFGQQGDYQWRCEWPAASFKYQLDRFMRLRGWDVLDGAVVGADCVTLVVERKYCRAIVLCLKPQRKPTPEALDALAGLGQSSGVSKTVLISERRTKTPPHGGTDDAKLMRLQFSDIPKIEFLLGLN
jgi:hypothetical protein